MEERLRDLTILLFERELYVYFNTITHLFGIIALGNL